MQLDFYQNLFQKENSKLSSFIKDLTNYINNYSKVKSETYCVMSDVDTNNSVYIVIQNGSGAGKHFNIADLPVGTTRGTILRIKNGKFIIDEDLTNKSIENLNFAKQKTNELKAEYKTEGVDYLVKEFADDYVVLQNLKTGLEFDVSDFKIDVFNRLYEGLILTCKNGEYIIKDN